MRERIGGSGFQVVTWYELQCCCCWWVSVVVCIQFEGLCDMP